MLIGLGNRPAQSMKLFLEEVVPKGLCWPCEATLTYGYITVGHMSLSYRNFIKFIQIVINLKSFIPKK